MEKERTKERMKRCKLKEKRRKRQGVRGGGKEKVGRRGEELKEREGEEKRREK